MTGAVEIWEGISEFIPHSTVHVIVYPGLKLIHVSERASWSTKYLCSSCVCVCVCVCVGGGGGGGGGCIFRDLCIETQDSHRKWLTYRVPGDVIVLWICR